LYFVLGNKTLTYRSAISFAGFLMFFHALHDKSFAF